MVRAIARVWDLFRAAGAPRGRHRAVPRREFRLGSRLVLVRPYPSREGTASRRTPDPEPVGTALALTVRQGHEPIDGTSTPLVRPYLAAHEREEKARVQRLRRDILRCATYGVDLDLRDIHAHLGAAS